MKKELLHANVAYDLVNRNDTLVRIGTKRDANRLGLWQRVVHIFIFNNKKELLICRRPKTTRAYPGVWTSSAGGHVEHGERYRASAARELYEELGLRLNLQDVGIFEANDPRHGKKLTRLFAAKLPHTKAVRPDPNEVAAYKFESMQKLQEDIARFPRRFAHPFRKAFVLFLEKRELLTHRSGKKTAIRR